MSDIIWPKIWGLLLVPPGVLILLGLLGLFLLIWRRWLGGVLLTASLLAMYVMSMPLVGKRLMAQIEEPYRGKAIESPKPGAAAQAIVILGGGRYSGAPEYGSDTVSRYTLERLRYGARLAKQTGLPVLVSGGPVYGEEVPEAALMQHVLERDFDTRVRWLEGSSRTTFENAQRTKIMLAEAGIRTVYLVTHAGHMARAEWAFINSGLDVIPAPLGFTTFDRGDFTPLGYLPSATGLQTSSMALRERLGLYWYKRKQDAATAAEAVKEPE